MVPLAINLSKFTQKSVTTVDRYSLVYCGNISRYHMLELLFEVIGNLRKVFPEVKLNIVGSGQDEDYFRKLSIDMNLQENVVFHGFIEEGERFSDVISNNCLGIALYKDDENFIKYTEPAKVKTYLSFGVPVVVSKVPDIAEEIQCLKVGFAVRNNRDEIVAIISEYFNDRRMQALYRKNVREYVKTLDVNQLLQITFEKTFGRWGLI
jgi:glycosyltransferase involved in cell wall biosynthesis